MAQGHSRHLGAAQNDTRSEKQFDNIKSLQGAYSP
jgi:hypothetical protein